MISDVMITYASSQSYVAANLIDTYYFYRHVLLCPVKKISKLKSDTGGALGEEVVTCIEVLISDLRRTVITRRQHQ